MNIMEHEPNPVNFKGWLFSIAAKVMRFFFQSELEEWISDGVEAELKKEKKHAKGERSSEDRLYRDRLQRYSQNQTHAVIEPKTETATQTVAATAALKRELEATQVRLARLQVESQGISALEEKVYALKNPVKVADELVALVSYLCKSPVLFFDYTENTGLSTLQSTGGFSQGTDPDSLSFRLTSEARDQIFSEEKKSGTASLAEYQPLTSVLMQKLGVAYFEAWVMTGFAPLGRLSGKRQILGVIVILNAGVDSALQRESIERMLRSIGLVYENAIHAS